MKDFSLQLHSALHRFVGNTELQVRALHGVRNRRRIWFPGWFAGELDQPVVFVERERDIASSRYGRTSEFVCCCKTRENQHPCHDY